MEREVVIVGAGVAGSSLAHFLTAAGVPDVLLIEREDRPALHASGRSAEALVELELEPVWRDLVLEGARFLRQPPPEVAPGSLVRETGVVNLMDPAERAALEAARPWFERAGVAVELLEPAELHRRLPWLTERDHAGAMFLPGSGRLRVGALIEGYLGAARGRGAEVWLGTELLAVETAGGRVVGVQTDRGPVRCRTLVCAAGPWAGAIARLAGASEVPLSPLRRTVITFDPPEGVDVAGWPLVSFDSRGIYLAPEGQHLLASPMDEDPIEACDARPTEEGIRLTLERLGRMAAPLLPRSLRGARAGLRTFAPDRHLVLGEDPALPGFIWLAGQGGWGIETSPAVGRIAAELIVTGRIADPDLAAAVAPGRFAEAPTR